MSDWSKRLVRSEISSMDKEKETLSNQALLHVSRQIWGYYGYEGTISPWHDNPGRWLGLKPQKKALANLYQKLKKFDIDPWSYYVLLFILTDYTSWERPALLVNNTMMWPMIKKLRKHVGSADNFKRLAQFVLDFIQLQVEHCGRAYISLRKVVEANSQGAIPVYTGSKNKTLAGYHRLWDKLCQLDTQGIPQEVWLEEKFRRCLGFVKSSSKAQGQDNYMVSISLLINPVDDPPVASLIAKMNDPWKDIRLYLGLSPLCQFPDGYIPKGWRPLATDDAKLDEITSITGEGFYYRKDGSQRKGLRHYATNKYYLIKCDTTNFKLFKDEWKKESRITQVPTWAEYSAWAAFPNLWDCNGLGLQMEGGNIIRNVKWRGARI